VTPEHAQAALEALGSRVRPHDIQLELRDDRWFAFLPGNQLAVFPISAAAAERVARERAVLRALENRCSFHAPRVVAEAPDGSCDLRTMVPGVHATFAVYARVRDDVANAERVGRTLGEMIAELHTRVRSTDIATPLPSIPEWPHSRAWIRERLPHVIDDRSLEAAADRIVARFEDSNPAGSPSDRVLVHTDLGLHNISIDADSLTVHGIFDWESACWSDRHFDFRHLLLGTESNPLFDAAAAVYEERTGFRISRACVFLHNAALAVTYLAFRQGIAPEERWCGRTLEEDLHWTRTAIARVGEAD
jgi:Ser/Thr protein kinase RdoA (MazF antagonist)